jgi:hypothetical protein
LHALLDPELDVAVAIEALRTMLHPRTSGARDDES